MMAPKSSNPVELQESPQQNSAIVRVDRFRSWSSTTTAVSLRGDGQNFGMDDPLSLGERNADLTDVCLFESISDDDLSSVGGDYEEDQKKDPSQPRRIKKVERGRQKKRIVFYDLQVDQTSPAVSGISNDAEWGMDWDGHEEDSLEIDEDDCVTRPPDIDLDDVKKGLQSVLRSYDKTHTSSSPSKDDQERVKLCRWAKEARMPSQRKGSGITSMDSKPLPESPKTDSPPKHPELIVLKSRSLGSTPSKKRVNHALGEAKHLINEMTLSSSHSGSLSKISQKALKKPSPKSVEKYLSSPEWNGRQKLREDWREFIKDKRKTASERNLRSRLNYLSFRNSRVQQSAQSSLHLRPDKFFS